MSQVRLTVKQIMNLGLWDKVCEYKGYNPWILNEGGISHDDYIEFDDEFKKEEEIDNTIQVRIVVRYSNTIFNENIEKEVENLEEAFSLKETCDGLFEIINFKIIKITEEEITQ